MTADNEFIMESENDLYTRQRVLVHAFWVNSALVAGAGLIMTIFDVGDAMAAFLGGPTTAAATTYMTRGLTAWGIGGVVIFLVPALATYWARCGLKNK